MSEKEPCVTRLNPRSYAQWGRHRKAKWVNEHASAVTCAAIVVCAAVVVAGVKLSGRPSHISVHHAPPIRYFGVFEPDAPHSYAGIERFAHNVGRQPNLVSYYSGWQESFQKAFAETAASHGAVTLVQMDPTNISLSRIAAGRYDAYLKSFADDVGAFRRQVIISFGHEMNRFWYSWGYHHSRPQDFIAAWRHVVTVFRREGADNVKWLWVVNSLSQQTGPPRYWWPGSRYVTWVGVSGYYWLPNETFSYIFGRVIADVRRFTQDPVLIAETGVGPFRGQSHGIRDLFTGARAQHYLGLLWFDVHSHGGIYKGENWRLEGNPAALSTFRQALRG
jgi:glycosyl hydrolase family 26